MERFRGVETSTDSRRSSTPVHSGEMGSARAGFRAAETQLRRVSECSLIAYEIKSQGWVRKARLESASGNDSHDSVYHVYQLRAGFGAKPKRKCDTHKALDFPTFWFGTRRSVVQIHSPYVSGRSSADSVAFTPPVHCKNCIKRPILDPKRTPARGKLDPNKIWFGESSHASNLFSLLQS